MVGRFGAIMGQQHGSVIEFGRTTVAKRRPPPKNQECDFVSKTVLNIDVARLLEKFRLEYLYNF